MSGYSRSMAAISVADFSSRMRFAPRYGGLPMQTSKSGHRP